MRRLWALSCLFACADGKDGATPEGTPTWHQDVAPLVARHCSGCHVEGALAQAIPLDSYDSARLWGAAMQAAVVSRRMPPFQARETPECTPDDPWMHDPRLSDENIDLISRWVDHEMPEGDPETAAPLLPPAVVQLEGRISTHYAEAAVSLPVTGAVTDQFICLSLDPGLLSDGWLTGFELLPDDARVMHHALVAVDAAGGSAALAGADGQYTCLGGFGVPATFIGAWVPGAAPMVVPSGSAVQVPVGARLVVQLHYHLIGEPVQDATGLAVAWADEAPARPALFGLFGNANGLQPDPNDGGLARLYVPAGARDHVERLVIPWTITQTLRVFMVLNHMHFIGRRMRVWVERAGSDDRCLLDTPEWDFDWQQSFFYDAAAGEGPVLQAGDVLHLECTYDNSLEHAGTRRALTEAGLTEPVDIGLGEGSLDEMCLVSLGGIPVSDAAAPAAPTHVGTATLRLRTADGVNDDACTASAAVAFDVASGVLLGEASCEVQAYGATRRLTAGWSGAGLDGGELAGPGWFDLTDFARGDASWTGSVDGEELTIEMAQTYPLTPALTVEVEATLRGVR